MAKKRRKSNILWRKLLNKRRLVILNEDTFEETFSLKLTLMNVFVVFGLGAILIIFFTTYIIAFTPLREYIPGYASTKLKQDALELAIKSDSLERVVKNNNAYISSIKKVLTGDLEYAKFNKDSFIASEQQQLNLPVDATETEKELRDKVIQEDKYNVFESAKPKVSFVLFPPVQGKIIEKYSAKNKHLAVKLAVMNNTPIKAVATGTIVFADWTPTNGYVIIVRHQEAILSVYKNAASITKKQGDTVKSGEVIALAGGNSATVESNITLHFELWKDGFPIDPTQFINYE